MKCLTKCDSINMNNLCYLEDFNGQAAIGEYFTIISIQKIYVTI